MSSFLKHLNPLYDPTQDPYSGGFALYNPVFDAVVKNINRQPGALQTLGLVTGPMPTPNVVQQAPIANSNPGSTLKTAEPVITTLPIAEQHIAESEFKTTGTIVPNQPIPFRSEDHMQYFLYKVFQLTRDTVGWVIQQYVDFFRLIGNFHGDFFSLWKDIQIVWKTLIVTGLTLGLLELGEVAGIVARLMMGMYELVKVLFNGVWKTVDEILYLGGKMTNEVTALFTKKP